MDKNRCDLLVKKAVALCSSKIGTTEDLQYLECNLNVKLPDDFKHIFSNVDYGEINCPFINVSFPEGVCGYTQDLRKDGLPHRFLLLSGYSDDAGSVFMETQDDPEKPTPIYWCDEVDVFNLCEEGVFKYNPTIWASFTDFFEYLVNEEEKMQLSDGRLKAPIKMKEQKMVQDELF